VFRFLFFNFYLISFKLITNALIID
jgi:hypothetical protein